MFKFENLRFSSVFFKKACSLTTCTIIIRTYLLYQHKLLIVLIPTSSFGTLETNLSAGAVATPVTELKLQILNILIKTIPQQFESLFCK